MNTDAVTLDAYDAARQALEAHLGPLNCEPGDGMHPTCYVGDVLVMDAYGLPDSAICRDGWLRVPGVDFIYRVLERGGEYQWAGGPPVLRARRVSA